MNSNKVILDSGAVALYNKHVNGESHGTCLKDRASADYSFFRTKEFKRYRDEYIKFAKKNHNSFAAYINLDVIFNAKLSYESLKYMEDQDCTPLPVFHVGSNTKWLRRYIDEGYGYICIAGMYPERFSTIRPILDRIWKDILTDSRGKPRVKVHGLAATSYTLMRRYPWYSVDSSTPIKASGYGNIYVPRARNGRFTFSLPPYIVSISAESNSKKNFSTMSNPIKSIIKCWLDQIGIPLGSADEERGVIFDYEARMVAIMKYYLQLAKSLPYELTVYFAGSAPKNSRPEKLFEEEEKAGVMLTYFDVYTNNGSPTERIKDICI